MYDRPKGNFSFLIGFVRQLEAAIETGEGRHDDVSHAVATLAACLDLLISLGSGDAGQDDGGLSEGVDDLDAPGDDTPLGAALRRIAELESSAASVDMSEQRTRLSAPADCGDAVSRKRRRTPVLKGARRGKK